MCGEKRRKERRGGRREEEEGEKGEIKQEDWKEGKEEREDGNRKKREMSRKRVVKKKKEGSYELVPSKFSHLNNLHNVFGIIFPLSSHQPLFSTHILISLSYLPHISLSLLTLVSVTGPIVTMVAMFLSRIILQKSSFVLARGCWVTMNSWWW